MTELALCNNNNKEIEIQQTKVKAKVKFKKCTYEMKTSSEIDNHNSIFLYKGKEQEHKGLKGHLSNTYLPKLHSPLVKRIDAPNKTFYSNSVFIDCQQLGKQIGADISAKK